VKILITGASGFVGAPLVRHLAGVGHDLVALTRAVPFGESSASELVKFKAVGDIDGSTNWSSYLDGVDAVVHLANRAHVMNEPVGDPLKLYSTINTSGTLQLARQAGAASVKRFIFISSIKVNGELSLPHKPFRADDVFIPFDPYGLSKYEAEVGLKKIAKESSLEVVIIRPPLIYGPGVKANFLNMMRWVERGIPLPLGSIQNQRSLLSIDNLIDFIQLCLTHPKAAGQTFLVSDDHDLSTTELLKGIARSMGQSSKLVPFPQCVLEGVLGILGQRRIAERLCGSLQLDIQPTKDQLGWQPPYSVEDQLIKTIEAYRLKKSE
jgi:nucleoside-diphosphate-sugar epimerase